MAKAPASATAATSGTATTATFESFREEVTGWIRPGHHHGCPPVEVIPGLWTSHFDDIDEPEKLAKISPEITLVVNSALSQCPPRTGFYPGGNNVRVLEVNIEDDPDERKNFDKGLEPSQSKCRDPSVAPHKRCAGDMLQYFDKVADEIHDTIQSGSHVLVHCKASLSRSPALILAYLMKYHSPCNGSLLKAGKLLKSKFDATWPCDRFSYDLVEYKKRLAKPYRLSQKELIGIMVGSSLVGAVVATALSTLLLTDGSTGTAAKKR